MTTEQKDRTLEWANQFGSAADKLENNPDETVHPIVRKAMLDALRSQEEDLRSQLKLGSGSGS